MSDIQSIFSQLTLEEKAALCTGASMWTTVAVERLGVPAIVLTDGPHGVRLSPDVNSIGKTSLPATCFPTASCLAATWDRALIRQVGEALGAEARALGVGVLLGPGINMKRDPRCGRNFEYYAEDPFLAGELAASFIQGVQSQGVGTSLKHFAVNNQETERFRIDALVDERTLREIYLPPFEAAVKEAHAWAVMASYNKLNGVYTSEHHGLLIDLLKEEWGFDGVVMSDWFGSHSTAGCAANGLDLEMPGPARHGGAKLVEAVQSGQVSAEAVRKNLAQLTEGSAEAAMAVFVDKYGAKYPKPVDCLTKDREALLTFFDFPAEHWDHLRTSNPIESVFATVRHRTVRTKGSLSHKTARLMVFKLVMAAAKTWRRLKGENQLPMVIAGVNFADGVAVMTTSDQRAA